MRNILDWGFRVYVEVYFKPDQTCKLKYESVSRSCRQARPRIDAEHVCGTKTFPYLSLHPKYHNHCDFHASGFLTDA